MHKNKNKKNKKKEKRKGKITRKNAIKICTKNAEVLIAFSHTCTNKVVILYKFSLFDLKAHEAQK
jgi:hypothetical protein